MNAPEAEAKKLLIEDIRRYIEVQIIAADKSLVECAVQKVGVSCLLGLLESATILVHHGYKDKVFIERKVATRQKYLSHAQYSMLSDGTVFAGRRR